MLSALRASTTDARWSAAVFAGAMIVAVAITWPLALSPGRVVAHDVGDPLLNTWLLWWNSAELPLSSAWWNAPMFFPAAGVMAFSEHLLGLWMFTSPVIWISGNPLLAYNLMLLLTFAFSAVAAFLLLRALGIRHDAALIGAALFAFAPYRLAQLSHLQVLASYWMPIGLLGLHKYLDDGRKRWLITFAIAWLMQSLSNGYYAVFFSVLVACWIAWHARVHNWRRIAAIIGAGVVSAAFLAPIIWKYLVVHETHGFYRGTGEVLRLSADVASLLQASPLSATWGWLNEFPRGEGELFPGLAAPALIIVCGVLVLVARRGTGAIAVAFRQRSAALFYPIAAVVMFLFALGPAPTYYGTPILPTAPYAWLNVLPGTSSLRVPARFAMLMALCLAVGAALIFARATARWPRRRQIAAVSFVLALAVADTWTTHMPLWDPPRTWDIGAHEIDSAFLVLPMLNAYNDIASAYRTRTLRRSLVNGYSGHIPPWYRALGEALNELDPGVLDALAASGVTQIIVVRRNDTDGTWRRYVETRATKVRDSNDGLFTLFDLPGVAPIDLAPRRHISIVRAAATGNSQLAGQMIDGDEQTVWATPQLGEEVVTIELEQVQQFDGIEFVLGQRRGLDYPRQLVIEASADGNTWKEIWRGKCAGAAIAGAMRETARMPMRIDFERSTARVIRLRQISDSPKVYWSIAELSVLSR